jgi:predicted membrane protein
MHQKSFSGTPMILASFAVGMDAILLMIAPFGLLVLAALCMLTTQWRRLAVSLFMVHAALLLWVTILAMPWTLHTREGNDFQHAWCYVYYANVGLCPLLAVWLFTRKRSKLPGY